MKNQKGVTLTVLVTTIIIMATIVGSVTYSSIASTRMNQYYNMCSDIELLDEKIAIYYLENNFTLPTTDDESKKLSELIDDYNDNNINYNPNNSGNLKKIDLNKLNNLSLNNQDYYIDEQSHTIYSAKGVKVEGKTYFTTPLKYIPVD